jgi:hypothetical protein
MPVSLTRIRDAAMAGALGGLGAGLVFATLHAFIITPIWDRMYGGLFGASVTGAIVAWAYVELMGDESRSAAAETARASLFGAMMWLVVAPVTLADVVLKLLPQHTEYVDIVTAVAFALSAGGLWGRLRTGRWRGTIAGAAATMALTMAMGGPVPIGKSVWALGIWLAVLPACVVAGALLGLVLSLMRRREFVMAR